MSFSGLDQSTESHVCFATVGSATIEHVMNHASILDEVGVSYCLQVFPNEPYSNQNEVLKISQNPHSLKMEDRNDFQKHQSSLIGKKHITVLQSPYLGHYPAWLKDEMRLVPFAYLGYGISLSNWHEGHNELPVYKHLKLIGADTIFGFASKKIRYWHSTKLFGDGLMNRLFSLNPKHNAKNLKVLWAPHWSQTWPGSNKGYSRFLDSIQPIVNFLKVNPEHRVTIRPHPILLDAINLILGDEETKNREVLTTARALAPHRNQIRDLINCPGLEFSSDTLINDILLHGSLVTDGVSIIAYWGITGKPMAIWRDEESPGLNSLGSIICRMYRRVGTPELLFIWLTMERKSPKYITTSRKLMLQLLLAIKTSPPIIQLLRHI